VSGVSLVALTSAGIDPAAYAWADRILAGLAAMPDHPDTDLTRAIEYIKGDRMTTTKKGRKPAAPATAEGPQFVGKTPPVIAAAEERMNLVIREAEGNAQALAEQLGYDGSLTVGALEDEIRFYQRRTAEACMEMGKRLLVLRELTPHGEFKQRVELLDIDYTMATRFMGAALKFGKVATSQLLSAANSQSKLLELAVLDDAEIAALEAGESARNITLDDVDTMSVRELRAALREAKEDQVATERVLADKNAKIDALTKKTRKRAVDPWPDEVAGLKTDLNSLSAVADEALGKVLTLIDATEAAMEPLEEGGDAFNGYKTVVHHLGATVDRLATLVAGLRREHDTRLAPYIAIDLTHTLED
jgi:hypothetical protein